MRRRLWHGALALAVLVNPLSVYAGDGVLEISQSCAEGPGCFPGDQPGFPVEITQRTSYRLTSRLVVDDINVDGVLITTNRPTLDLNGFEISGPATCTGNGASRTCTDGAGVGVRSTTAALRLSNGVVTGFGGGCVVSGDNTVIDSVYCVNNNRGGFDLGEFARVTNSNGDLNGGFGFSADRGAHIESCRARGNQTDGIRVDIWSLVESNRIFANGGWGVGAGQGSIVSKNVIRFHQDRSLERSGQVTEPGGNSCDEGCSPDGRKLFYLSRAEVPGDQALAQCEVGFHMASLYEIQDISSFYYDRSRGLIEYGGLPRDNSGGPMSFVRGWIRTGGTPIASGGNGTNCWHWSLGTSDAFGSAAAPDAAWSFAPTRTLAWRSSELTCDTMRPVWCVQD